MNVQKINFTDPLAPQLFQQSLQQTGFAVLVDHPIAAEQIQQLYERWQAFFESEDKEPYFLNRQTQEGYVPPSIAEIAKGYDVRDLKAFYNYYPWGICPPHLKAQTQAIYEQLRSTAEILLSWLDAKTPAAVQKNFVMPLTEMIKGSDNTLFRINYYPPLKGDEETGALRAAAHEDIDLLTILTAGTTTGLQVRDVKGDWHDVPCDPGNLVINAGDMLKECSHGFYPSTTHRVLKPQGEAAKVARLSCPLFLHPLSEVVLSERYTAGEYLTERLTEIGLMEK
jgi:isopenicillin N synthase-like dioxygenase